MEERYRGRFPSQLSKGQWLDEDRWLSQDGGEETYFLPLKEESKIALQNQCAAVEHNNHAVLLLKQGCYLEALECLTRALQFCRKAMVIAPMQRLVESNSANIPRTLDAYLGQEPSFPVKSDQEDERPYYNHLVRIPCIVVDSSYRTSVLLSTLVTFNFSLVNHVLGLLMLNQCSCNNTNHNTAISTSMTTTHLQVAAKSYQLAYEMQHAEGFTHNNLFESAVLNNLGLLHSQLGNYPAADTCWEHLWRLVRENIHTEESQQDGVATSPAPQLNRNAATTRHYYHRFWRNLSVWFSQSTSAAAA